MPVLQMGKLRLDNTARWQSWDSNMGLPDFKYHSLFTLPLQAKLYLEAKPSGPAT